MRRRGKLSLELGASEPERFELANELGISNGATVFSSTLALELLYALLNPRIGINQSLSGITHNTHYKMAR